MNSHLEHLQISAEIEHRWVEFSRENADIAASLSSYAEDIQALWSQSKFAQRQGTRSPHWLEEMVALQSSEETFEFEALLAAELVQVVEEKIFKQKLREFRNKHLLFICWHELVLNTDVSVILNNLSELADACVRCAEKWLRQKLIDTHGSPLKASGETAEMLVIALGKLGGKELNFSSDIDVMFCYPETGQTQGHKPISNQEFFTKHAQGLINALAEITADGFVYRVDCRLRPFGESGPLAVNFNHLEDYLEVHGREWERYAFIKARALTGTQDDIKQFEAIVSAFIYRRYLDYGVIQTLREMKDMIAQQVVRKGNTNNIKLGKGGIREIEFIIQFIQLVHGGQAPQLHTRSIYQAFYEIELLGYLSLQEIQTLKAAYEFLRRVENRLQMVNDEQTHVVPIDEVPLLLLAQSMGFEDIPSFDAELQKHLNNVSHLFSLIRSDEDKSEDIDIYTVCWTQLVQADRDEIDVIEDFTDYQQICAKLQTLINSPAYKNQDDVGRQRLNALMPVLLRELHALETPELVVDRLLPLLKSILRRSAYLVYLFENQDVLRQLITVVSSSPWIASHIASYPLLLDELVVATEEANGKSDLLAISDQFEKEVLKHSADLSYEEILEHLRMFKHARELRIACADVQNHLPLMDVSNQLSWTAETVIDGCLKYLQHDFEQSAVNAFAVIAFGKLGGYELSYGSDLDLVFIAKNESQADYPAQAKLPYTLSLAKVAQRLIQMLSLQTVSGRLYDVDTRLRPDGSSGPIVAPFAFFQQYYQKRAWTWELQALVRARCVAGEESMRRDFLTMRHDLLCQPRELDPLAVEVKEMRDKMLATKASKSGQIFHIKNDEGGITDIEFVVQYAVLAYASKDNTLTEYTDNVRLLERLADSAFLPNSITTEMTEIYCEFRAVMHQMALQSQQPEVDSGKFVAEREVVRAFWNEIFK